ncbi:MAG: 50S ribosomal protein L32e [Methanomassiliicoccales archaeon]|jgi:large subunit ribosomal protein L32e
MAKNKKEIKELADLPYYREEYTAQLEKMGITTLPELLSALKESKKKQKIVDELEGVGVKIADHWIEVMEESPEESTALVTKESKTEIIEEADAEIVEKGAYVTKIKPVLSAEVKAMLEKRAEVSGRRPEFRRQEWFRYAKLGIKWRKPRGMHSKMRRHYKYRPTIVSIGFRGPALVRGLASSGFQEVLVYNPSNLDKIDPNTQAARIGGTVGGKKRATIIEKADQLKIRVLNR